MSHVHEYYARICDAAGIDTIQEHYGLVANQKVSADAGGLEIIQRIIDSAKGLLSDIGIHLDDTTLAEVKAAMDRALDKAFELIDWPYLPDGPVDFFLRKVAHWGLEKLYNRIKAGS